MARDSFSNRTPLMFASNRNAVEATRALIDADADLAATTDVKDYVEISKDANTENARRTRVRRAFEEPDPDAEQRSNNNSRREPCVPPDLP